MATDIAASSAPLELSLSSWLVSRAPRDLSVQDRQALLAYQRAVLERDPLGKVAALWDAIEFYVASTRVEPLFSDAQLDAFRAAIPAGLRAEQHQRALGLVAQLNSPPLLTRLKAALQEDGVPVAQEEIALLQRLRKSRNDAVHGHGGGRPIAEDVQHGLAVVSRMLVHRLHPRVGG